MSDVMPPDIRRWQYVEETAKRVFGTYGYQEIRTPIIESTDLFRRGVGESTSIVEKEMYSFVDQGDATLSLRPEGTASVVRAYIETGVCNQDSQARFYYMGPMFRRERPQKGRQRQFYQIGCELLDVVSPEADAEVIAMADHFLSEVGADGLTLEINSIGCAKCRPSFNEALLKYFISHKDRLCDDCVRRLERNPLRVLDCKNEGCGHIVKDAPKFSDHWCEDCRDHFAKVKLALESLKIDYVVNEKIVRGLDYYTRTAFEFTTDKLGAQNAILGGGRYDGLVKDLGGPDIAGVGFAIGLDRLVQVLDLMKKDEYKEDLVYFCVIGERARSSALPVIQMLRKDGVRVVWDYAGHSLKSQMRRAGKLGAESVVIIGDDEMSKGEAIIRDMRAGTQHSVRIKDLPMHFVNIGG